MSYLTDDYLCDTFALMDECAEANRLFSKLDSLLQAQNNYTEAKRIIGERGVTPDVVALLGFAEELDGGGALPSVEGLCTALDASMEGLMDTIKAIINRIIQTIKSLFNKLTHTQAMTSKEFQKALDKAAKEIDVDKFHASVVEGYDATTYSLLAAKLNSLNLSIAGMVTAVEDAVKNKDKCCFCNLLDIHVRPANLECLVMLHNDESFVLSSTALHMLKDAAKTLGWSPDNARQAIDTYISVCTHEPSLPNLQKSLVRMMRESLHADEADADDDHPVHTAVKTGRLTISAITAHAVVAGRLAKQCTTFAKLLQQP